MTKNKKTSAGLSARAHALAERTGQAVPEPGFVLTPEVEAFVDGEGQIGVEYDLRAFLAERSARRYDCYECGEDVYTATDPTTVQFTVSVFDPDLNPGTYLMMTQYAHAGCAPSAIRWVVPAETPRQPYTVSLDTGVDEDGERHVVRYDIKAVARLAPSAGPGQPPTPVLLLDAEVENYEPHPGLYELFDHNLIEDGFTPRDIGDMSANGWSLRLEHPGTGPLTPSWIAVRAATAPPEKDTGHGHFFLGDVDLTDAWASAARERGQVLLLVGPLGPHTSLPDFVYLVTELEDVLGLVDDGLVRGGWCPVDAPAAGHARPARTGSALTRT
ncbi:hypothetical protein [Streptomyces sp. NPDC056672]|uniref:hypothetical protein n=1 Tax=Streptomyces sp. NPDC056672 TaxID=3345906 RepID=UPI0036765F22